MIFPSEPEFRKLREKGGVVPMVLKLNADELTPIGLFYSLKGKKKFLLESVESGKNWGRYSFLGCNPYMMISSYGDQVFIEKDGKTEIVTGKVLDEVKKHISRYGTASGMELPPFAGGAVGYVGYDVVRQYEKLPDKNPDLIQVPEAYLMFYKDIIVYDHFYHIVSIICNVLPEDEVEYSDVVDRLIWMKDEIIKMEEIHPLDMTSGLEDIYSNYDKESFCGIVQRAKEYIAAGDVFQVVLSQRLTVITHTRPFDAYRKLRFLNPSPYMFYIDFEDFQIVGSSPESLVSVEGRTVKTNPIAGTRPRGRTNEEDERLKEELLADEKERAEHVMLVDLGRNDIGKVSEFGSVKVDRFLGVDMYSHVMHIVSTVSGRLKDDKDCFDALVACLPAGTVSGAPKIRAMEIIDELENTRRGIYAGAIGYFAYTGNMDMCIAIRTIVFKGQKAYIQAGAGIVYDSVPELEYQETLNKAMALKEVL
ncbi:anthranilate synthase component I [Caldicoprobacter faecalis]|uniref:Anthranilate synthase component 1 n=1 Tax=Caldicoprobacter faecalis TaxID=937334 RepID=A0A1I5SBV6_9FIRM|nr:anthranilate synthase component I [Caldicoprobacter faecalis]SFP68244.1 anthranilate synthase component 1 [Caldicoprobacter faecalis]